MADNPTIAEIKTAETKAAEAVNAAKAAAVQKLNSAQTEAENKLKEARQTASRQYRDKIRRAEEAAEIRAKDILSKREADAQAFYNKQKEKVAGAASWITEEVMGRYGRG